MPLLILTRPQAASERFAAQVAGQVDEIVISPILEIVKMPGARPVGTPGSVVFSSEHAVALYEGPRDIPAFAVGGRTARAAREAGFEVALEAPTAQALLDGFPSEVPEPVWHVRGQHVAAPIVDVLRARGVTCAQWIVYDQAQQPLAADVMALLQGERHIVLPLFSPRSAALVSQELPKSVKAPLHLVAMSHAVMTAWRHPDPHSCRVAEAPNAQAMGSAVAAAYRDAGLLEGGPSVP
ncbi:uroporphyrinogen-III synthase [Roseobacteraceae bacterium S113]